MPESNPGSDRAAVRLALALSYFNFVAASAARVVLTLYALHLEAPAYAVGLIGGLLYLFPLLLSWFIGTQSLPEDRARNFSYFSLTGSLTNFVGPVIGGFTIDHAGHAMACLVLASQPLVGVALLLAWGRLFRPGNPHAQRGPGALGALKERGVRRMIMVSGLVQLGQDLFSFYLPIYAHAAGLSASAIGTILAALASASFVVRLFLAHLVHSYAAEKLLVWVFFSGAIGYALVPFFTDPLALGAVSFFFGLGMGIGIPLTVIMMFEQSAEGRSGQTLGLRLTGNNFVRMAGPIVFGAVGTALGLAPVFLILGATMVGGGVLALTGGRAPPR